ncbi:hypothetical protein KA005_33905, partial [bacterium]|nr:hypothetical protein [bacterium]
LIEGAIDLINRPYSSHREVMFSCLNIDVGISCLILSILVYALAIKQLTYINVNNFFLMIKLIVVR